MAETVDVIVEKVDGPNSNGWYEVEFTGGNKASTKDENLAKAAFQSRGTEVSAVISEVTKGKYTNVYLNEIDGVKEAGTRGRKRTTAGAATPPTSDARDQRIARQWAYGRAVELLVGSGSEFAFPLDSATMSQLSEQAEAFLNATKES